MSCCRTPWWPATARARSGFGYWTEVPDELRDAEAVIAIGEPLVSASVEVFTYPQEDYTGFDDYVSLTEDWLRSDEFGESTIDDVSDVTADDLPAVRFEVTASSGGVNQVMWWVLVHGEHAYYDVVGWTVPSEREQTEPVIAEVMASFEELEDEI
ncbi:hypothetical protein SAMN06265360_11645 [Haloechinothrix alba]|uniref:Uncharacterized protein n=1 Tax=Haloechinothrix alba TaxID=664784 RepID=A0A238YNN4_9PSEU|nr:hypothetical protein SAMN06265360_11645 [Haloechinothrix alba]